MAEPVTLVIGLGREVGDSIARTFLEAGHRVLVADPSAERLESAQDALGDEIATYHGELHSRLGLRNAITAALAESDETAIVIGGDCAVALPAITHAAGRHSDLAVVWFGAR